VNPLAEKHNPLKKLRFMALALVAVMVVPMNAVAVPPAFLQSSVDTAVTSGEPRVFVDPTDPGAVGNPATVYDIWPVAGVQVFKSMDGGISWPMSATTLGGGGDADIAIDGSGCVYIVEPFDAAMNGNVPVSSSCGAVLAFGAPVPSLVPAITLPDRPWIAATGLGAAAVVTVTYNDGGTVRTRVSFTAGATWIAGGTIPGVSTQGPIFYGPGATTLYTIYSAGGVMMYAFSTTSGLLWTTGVIGPEPGGAVLFPVMAADVAGNLYAAWSGLTSAVPLVGIPLHSEIHFAKSTNGGATWSPIIPLSTPDHSAVFPWVTANLAGGVDIMWVQDQTPTGRNISVGSDLGTPVTQWDLVMAQSTNAAALAPTFTTTMVLPDVHTGSICTQGILCLGPQNVGVGNLPTPLDRRLLDFFAIASDGFGNALISYARDRPFPGILVGDLILSWVDMDVAVQTSGTTI
jgi:hypothetical protein